MIKRFRTLKFETTIELSQPIVFDGSPQEITVEDILLAIGNTELCIKNFVTGPARVSLGEKLVELFGDELLAMM